MKKKNFMLLVILLVVAIAITCTVIFVTRLNIYIINEDVCSTIFAWKTPQEFCDNKGKGTHLKDYTFATIDKNGNLLLVLTDSQLQKWISSSSDLKAVDIVAGGGTGLFEEYDIDMEDKFKEAMFRNFQEGTVEVSDDYKKVTIQYGEDHGLFVSFTRTINGCVHMQLLNGVSSDDITLQLVVVKENGEIVTDLTWPNEDLVYTVTREAS